MSRATSPLYDIPDFAALRQMKSLPKRRRTTPTFSLDDILPPDDQDSFTVTEGQADVSAASSLSLDLNDMQGYLHTDGDGEAELSFDLGDESFSGLGDMVETEDDKDKPGNSKKRKVPANLGMVESEMGGEERGEASSGRALLMGRPEEEYESMALREGPPSITSFAGRKPKLSRATRAALKLKETLKARKQHYNAMLGAISEGDTLALDQLLFSQYPFVHGGIGTRLQKDGGVKVRLSRQRMSRLARAHRTFRDMLRLSTEETASFPSAEFTFSFSSAASDRVIATREEVAGLQARWDAHRAQQAARSATQKNGSVAAQEAQVKEGRSITRRGSGTKQIVSEQPVLGNSSKGKKKKKRSALANASNPHHLRNYVPSRLPRSGTLSSTQQNLFSPLPIHFLSADISPRRRKKKGTSSVPVSTLVNPAEEWICSFCEYDLFYGDERDFHRAVNNRKKVLRRRRRALERAAAAANGTVAAGAVKNAPISDDDDARYGLLEIGSVDRVAGKQPPSRSKGGLG